LAGFEKGRIHAVFTDNSSLIFQDNNSIFFTKIQKITFVFKACITYFFANGEKIRFYLDHIQTRDGIKEKVAMVLRMNNQYNENFMMNQEELYEDLERIQTLNKLNHCTWPVKESSIEKSIKYKEDGAIEFRAADNIATLRLLDNGVIFEVEYLQVLKKKKPMWVNKATFEDPLESKGTSTKDLIKELSSKRKSESKENKNVLKLAYEYVRVKKIFNIFDFPARWAYPLFIAFLRFEENCEKRGWSVKFQPNYPEPFLLFIQNYLDRNLEDTEAHNTELSQIGLLHISSDTLINELPNTEFSGVDSEQNSKVVSRNDVWLKDNVNPTAEFYLNEVRLSHQVSSEFTVWTTPNDEVLIWVRADGSLITSSNDANYFTHFYKNIKVTIDQYEQGYEEHEFKFSKDTVALVTRSKKNSSSYNLHEIVLDSVRIVKKCKLSKTDEGIKEIVRVDEDNKARELYRTMPFELIDQKKDENASYEAFKNRSVKVVFRDRTVVRINFAEEFANILSKYGEQVRVRTDNPKEYQDYVDLALQYYDDVFTDPHTKLQKLQDTMYRNEMIQFELEKNQRLLHLMSGTKPAEDFMGIHYGTGGIEQYNFYNTTGVGAGTGDKFGTASKMNTGRYSVYNQENEYDGGNRQHHQTGGADNFNMDDMSRKIQEQMEANEKLLNQIKNYF